MLLTLSLWLATLPAHAAFPMQACDEFDRARSMAQEWANSECDSGRAVRVSGWTMSSRTRWKNDHFCSPRNDWCDLPLPVHETCAAATFNCR